MNATLKASKWLGSLALSLAIGSQAHGQRTIVGDAHQVKGPTSTVWQDTTGAGRAAEGLRAGWREHLEMCRKEIGFRYLRMHGLLHDELGVYNEDRNGKPHYNWQYIDDIYDYLLSIGVRPFVELGFMPRALASGNATVFWWNGHITPPNDYAKWDALIRALVQHWTDRYGADEVRKWRFEIWNEPNLRMFWAPEGQSDRDAYFQLYEHTAKAVTSVDPKYAVGGPGGAGPVWTRELIEFCTEKNLPLDFISFHAYGLGGGPSGLDLYGNQSLYLNPNLHYVSSLATSQNRVIAGSAKPKLPVHITEWSASYSPRDPIHDAYFEAPFMLEQLRRTESVASMSYWTFTDVFEENGPVPRPFHGGFGLVNFQGIRKPAFWAYRFLSMLGSEELANGDPSSYVCRDEKGGYQVLAWDLTNPVQNGDSNQTTFFKTIVPKPKGSVSIRLKGLPRGKYVLRTFRIGYRQNDPYSAYLAMGSPTDLSREQVARLKRLSDGKPSSETTVTVTGDFSADVPLRENDVVLLTLEPVPSHG